MIDVATEEIDLLARATRWVPKGTDADGRPKKVSASTIWRWSETGVAGVLLETVYIGAVRYTSREALERFFRAVTAVRSGASTGGTPAPQQPTVRTDSRRKKASEKAAAEFEAMRPMKGRRARRATAAASK